METRAYFKAGAEIAKLIEVIETQHAGIGQT
jgi:hypothetical protein